jgi:rhodanese-related sulfurtransferase
VGSFLARLLGLFRGSEPTRMAPADFVSEREPGAPVLDVRTPREYASGHLAGSLNVDVTGSEFARRVDALAADGTIRRDAPVYLYCRSGNRSGKAVRILRDKGFDEAWNVGGLHALRAAGAELAD